MQTESQRQSALLAAIWATSNDAAMTNLRADAVPPARGLSVYRANSHATAERALGNAFATVHTMLGTENFEALAKHFLHHHPPSKGDLGEWGAALPAFIAAQADLNAWPYVADCARLDHAVHQCERASDADFDVASMARLGDTDPAQLRVQFLPGTALIESMWPLALIHQAHAQPEGEAREALFGQVRIALQTPQSGAALVCRDGWRASVTPVPAHEVAWTRQVLAGATLADALLLADPAFDFAAWLTDAVRTRRLKGIGLRTD
jgi:Putative DNA-binding domain